MYIVNVLVSTFRIGIRIVNSRKTYTLITNSQSRINQPPTDSGTVSNPEIPKFLSSIASPETEAEKETEIAEKRRENSKPKQNRRQS